MKRNDEMVPVKKDVLEAIRNRCGLTRPQLADLVGCSRSHYNNVEAGRKWAKKALAIRIARELRVSVAELIDYDQVATEAVS